MWAKFNHAQGVWSAIGRRVAEALAVLANPRLQLRLIVSGAA